VPITFDNDPTRFEIYAHAGVEGADPLPAQYRSGEFRPARITVATSWTTARPVRLTFVTVSGPIVKRDGTNGQQRGKMGWGPSNLDHAPEWVRIFVQTFEEMHRG
jgi:hypothetical protein